MQANTLTGVRGLDRDVLIRLSYEDLLRACSTNKSLSAYCRDDNFWKDFLQNKFPSIKSKKFVTYTYPTWRDYAEVIFTNANLYETPAGTLSEEMKEAIIDTMINDNATADQLQYLSAIALPYIKALKVRRGDIVRFDDLGTDYDSGKFIYNGESLESIGWYMDSYGYLTGNFTVEEFIDPSRWFTGNPRPIAGNNQVVLNLTNPVYQLVEAQPKYIIVRIDNVYYTIVPSPGYYEDIDWSQPDLFEFHICAFDKDNDVTNDDVYDEIRGAFKGYVLIDERE